MAPRKKKVLVNEAEAALPSLTSEELLNLRLIDAQARLADQTGRSLILERAFVLAKIDPQGRIDSLDQQIRQMKDQENENRRNYQTLLASVSKRVGVDLSVGCTIDPASGKIIQHTKKEQ